MFTLILLLSCNKKPILCVDTIEVNYSNVDDRELEGNLRLSELLGGNRILICDSLMMVVTSNTNAQLLVLNVNTLDTLGMFCIKGRAKNEFIAAYCGNVQLYKRDGHIIVPLIDGLDQVKEVDITESLSKGSTIIVGTSSCLRYPDGQTIFLDEGINNRFEYLYDNYKEKDFEEYRKAPSVYTLKKDGREKILKIFRRPLDTDNASQLMAPFNGILLKSPTKNIIVQMFSFMDYLLFFDLDNENYCAIHNEGSRTFEDKFDSDGEFYFQGGCSSSEYAMFLYYHGEKSMKEANEGDRKAQLIIFNWEGKYICNVQLDRRIKSIGYDELNNRLLALSFTEEVYEYDLSKILSN